MNNIINAPIEISIPHCIEDLNGSLFPLQRALESQYAPLPWPEKIKQIMVFTDVCGGLGDIAAAAKAIAVMQKMAPELEVDWVIKGSDYDVSKFLNCSDPSKVNIRHWGSSPPNSTPADFLLAGPVKFNEQREYTEARLKRKISGPIVCFKENAESLNDSNPYNMLKKIQGTIFYNFHSFNELYKKIHQNVFPNQYEYNASGITMGLFNGSGVFLDQNRMNAPLSRDYCCPSYLSQIEDVDLKQDIFEAMDVSGENALPNYDLYSFNSGYAHWPSSWAKYIHCIAVNENRKNVVIVLNQHGYKTKLSTEEFQKEIFTPERLEFLKKQRFTSVTLKGKDQGEVALINEGQGRSFKVIIRPSFLPQDMKRMQLASERLLATGDSTALEAWCSRCKLYLYEDVNNGLKDRFLQQQVDVAQDISPKLARLLALFGGDKRIPQMRPNQPLSLEQIEEMEQILKDPQISDDAFKYCTHITSQYSFAPILEAAMKRFAWHHILPELANIEAEGLDPEFKKGLVTYLKTLQNSTPLKVAQLHEIGLKVQEKIENHLLE